MKVLLQYPFFYSNAYMIAKWCKSVDESGYKKALQKSAQGVINVRTFTGKQ